MKQAVNIAFLLSIKDGINSFTKQAGNLFHIAPVIGLLIKLSAQFHQRFCSSPTEQSYSIQHFLGLKIIADDFPLFTDKHYVEGMDPVAVINIYTVVDVPQDKDHTSGKILRFCYNCVHSVGGSFHIIVVHHVLQQIQPKLIQSQVHDGNPCGHILYIHHFTSQPF